MAKQKRSGDATRTPLAQLLIVAREKTGTFWLARSKELRRGGMS
jgi:hypothetical protein